MNKINHNPELLHKEIYAKTPRKLAFSPDRDIESWREELRAKLSVLLGMHRLPDAFAVPEVVVTSKVKHTDFTEIIFTFESEPGYFAPCHLLIPKQGKASYPVVVCLQGHNSGMHLSLNRAVYEGDKEKIEAAGFRAYGPQAIALGYAALIMEQRCFGSCKNAEGPDTDCHNSSLQALMLGRTLMGERVYDVIRVISALSTFPEIDIARIGCMGNSGGGTTTYYTACLDDRIKIAMPSCSIGTYFGSIFSIYHCECNCIPHMLEWFEMQDLAVLIAPRKLLLINGSEDDIFPIEDSKKCFEGIRQIYKKMGCEENCRLVIGEGEHRFYPDEAWPAFKEMAGY